MFRPDRNIIRFIKIYKRRSAVNHCNYHCTECDFVLTVTLQCISSIECINLLYVHVTVNRNNFLFNKTNKTHEFPEFYFAQKSTCFGHFLCPSPGFSFRIFDIGIFLAVLMTASKQGRMEHPNCKKYTNDECTVENS
jgi:hypothetical protein